MVLLIGFSSVQTFYVLTISGYDTPGSERGINPPNHPEHTQPGQMFSSLVHLKELREVWVDYWHSTADTERQTMTIWREDESRAFEVTRNCFVTVHSSKEHEYLSMAEMPDQWVTFDSWMKSTLLCCKLFVDVNHLHAAVLEDVTQFF